MANTVTDLINTIDITFPVAGQDNDSQGFRNNFNIIRSSLLATEGQINDIENTISTIGSTVNVTATHIVALQDVKIGTTNTVLLSVDSSNNLVASFGTSSMALLGVGETIKTTTVSYTSGGTTATTFRVSDVRSILNGATVTLWNVPGTSAVYNISTLTNEVSVYPFFTGSNFVASSTATFQNPYMPVTGSLDLDGDLTVSGTLSVGGALTFDSDVSVNGNLGVAGEASFADLVTMTSTEATHSTNSGAVTVAGGMGIAGGLVVGGTLTATNLSISGAGFSASLTTTGYQKLPSGLIMNWGVATFGSEGQQSVSFAEAFTTAVFSAQATLNDTGGGGTFANRWAQVSSVTTTGMNVFCQQDGTNLGYPADIYWLAIGY